MSEQRSDAAPLAGLRVVDFSHFIAGPICTMRPTHRAPFARALASDDALVQ